MTATRKKNLSAEDIQIMEEYHSSAKSKTLFELANTVNKKVKFTVRQNELIKALNKNVINLVHGPAGSGKTFCAVIASLISCLHEGKKLVLIRPIFESATNKLGFLPGDLEEKLYPHKKVFEEILLEVLRKDEYASLVQDRKIIYEVLNFSRGITLKNAVIICDEAQNMTLEELMLITTRISKSSKIIFTGDFYQSDIKSALGSLNIFESLYKDLKGVNIFRFDHTDNHRHPIIQELTKIWEAYKNKQNIK
jgi:phosphate starvation-inducible protein PhoH and related proteins